jgi:hypothetical protein
VATGFGNSFRDAIRSISELSGIRQLAGPAVKVDFITAGPPDPATAAWQFLTTGGTFATDLTETIMARQLCY